jgi:hypothetical protein
MELGMTADQLRGCWSSLAGRGEWTIKVPGGDALLITDVEPNLAGEYVVVRTAQDGPMLVLPELNVLLTGDASKIGPA